MSMVFDLAVGDPKALERQVAALVRELNAKKGQIVLLFNKFGGNGYPDLFAVESAELSQREGKYDPLVSLRASGPVYELKTGLWVPDNYHDWGRNFFPGEKGSYLAIGGQDISETLRVKHNYVGSVPLIV